MRKLLTLFCVLVLAVVAAGCGSSGGSDSSSDDPTTTKAEASTTTTADDDVPETTEASGGAGSEDDYIAAVVANLTTGSLDDGNLVIEEAAGECVAPVWLDTITVEGFTGVDATPEDVAEPGFEFEALELDETQGQALIDAFEPCDVDIYAKLAESLTVGLTDEQSTCAQEQVDPALANELLITAFSTDSGDGTTEFSAVLDQLTEACDLPAN